MHSYFLSPCHFLEQISILDQGFKGEISRGVWGHAPQPGQLYKGHPRAMVISLLGIVIYSRISLSENCI